MKSFVAALCTLLTVSQAVHLREAAKADRESAKEELLAKIAEAIGSMDSIADMDAVLDPIMAQKAPTGTLTGLKKSLPIKPDMQAEVQNAMAMGGVGEEAEEEEEEEEHDLDVCAEIDIPSAKEGCKLAFAVDSEENKI